MNKKVVCGIMILMAVLLISCLDYKAYDIPKGEPSSGAAAKSTDNSNLVDEIAAIEKQLNKETPSAEMPTGAATSEVATTTEEASKVVPEEVADEKEVVLPDLSAETGKSLAEGSLDVVTVKENEMIRLHVKVSDPDNDKVTYSFSSPLNNNGEWKTSYGDAGEYAATITATDGKLTTTKKIKIVVERVNVLPVIEKLKDLTIKEGEKVDFSPKVTDPNKDKVTVLVSDPLSKGTWQTDHASAGEYQIKVTADDGELQTENQFTLHVIDVNVPPEVTGVPESMVVKEGQTVEIKPIVNDADNDSITMTISDPVGNDGVWETGYTNHGNYVITISVSDGKDTVIKKVNLQVDDVNMPPEIVDVYMG